MTREQLIREIAATEKKLAAAFQYEKRVEADAAKIRLACTLTNAHARKLQRLIDELVGMTRQNEPPITEQSAQILDFIRRAS